MLHRAALLTILSACCLAAATGSASAASTLGPAPAPASPAGGMPYGSLLTYTADATETPHVSLSSNGPDLVVTATTAVGWDVQWPCVVDSATVARCPLTDALVQRGFSIAAPGGAPRPMTLETAPYVFVPVYAVGTPGQPDHLQGGGGADVLAVGDGGTADGGPGADRLAGPGTLLGGDGDDTITGARTGDGGAGSDTILTTEHAIGGGGDDTLNTASHGGPPLAEGGPGNDALSGSGAGAVLRGGPGNDVLSECNMVCDAGAMVLEGGEGDDVLYGASLGAVLDGGDGADMLVAGGGPSGGATIVQPDGSRTPAGPGFAFPGNTIQGGAGDDTVSAGQAIADRIDCGDGADTAARDATDSVAACEVDTIVAHPAPSPYVDPYKDPYRDPYADPAAAPTASLAFRGSARVRASARGTVAIAVRCATGRTCRGRLRLRAGTVTLADARCSVKGAASVRVRLSTRGLALLRRHRHMAARLTFTPSGKGAKAPKARTITLLPPRRR